MIVTRGLGGSLLITRGYGPSGIGRYIRIVILRAGEYLRQMLRGNEYLLNMLAATERFAQKARATEYVSQLLQTIPLVDAERSTEDIRTVIMSKDFMVHYAYNGEYFHSTHRVAEYMTQKVRHEEYIVQTTSACPHIKAKSWWLTMFGR